MSAEEISAESGASRRLARSLKRQVAEAEAELLARRQTNRWFRFCLAVVATAVLSAGLVSAAAWGDPIIKKLILVCGVLVAAFGGVSIYIKVWVRRRGVPSLEEAESTLERIRDDLRWTEASNSVSSQVSQSLYKADVAAHIAQYQEESDKYRKIHNRLQSVIIVGSLGTTTVAALQSGEMTLEQWLTVGLSLAVGLAAGFMGYFKFRERSFYLQQTADLIEQEVNAMTLGIADYSGLNRQESLARLVERVEVFRNEQRRRQQQLDQPVEEQVAGSAEWSRSSTGPA
ncbi:DUF4231 domain-containing protein [Streptomyces sp. GF20]|uniref:DUF4231 domain-containing protein n=1 Tax=Streptomyces sp. GF20 TaxID=2692235 RepID=UPI00131940E9|nr:DUF4231 domain-containing protein [Streptomyces sp. GF20]QHC15550.1 DUF4231 domain-containing protein [Streptomyces sp. GF20]